jgi:hypothetical protein
MGFSSSEPPTLVWGEALIEKGAHRFGTYWQEVLIAEGEVGVRILAEKGQEPALWFIGDPIEVSKALKELLAAQEFQHKQRKRLTKAMNTIENLLFRAGHNYFGDEED